MRRATAGGGRTASAEAIRRPPRGSRLSPRRLRGTISPGGPAAHAAERGGEPGELLLADVAAGEQRQAEDERGDDEQQVGADAASVSAASASVITARPRSSWRSRRVISTVHGDRRPGPLSQKPGAPYVWPGRMTRSEHAVVYLPRHDALPPRSDRAARPRPGGVPRCAARPGHGDGAAHPLAGDLPAGLAAGHYVGEQRLHRLAAAVRGRGPRRARAAARPLPRPRVLMPRGGGPVATSLRSGRHPSPQRCASHGGPRGPLPVSSRKGCARVRSPSLKEVPTSCDSPCGRPPSRSPWPRLGAGAARAAHETVTDHGDAVAWTCCPTTSGRRASRRRCDRERQAAEGRPLHVQGLHVPYQGDDRERRRPRQPPDRQAHAVRLPDPAAYEIT